MYQNFSPSRKKYSKKARYRIESATIVSWKDEGGYYLGTIEKNKAGLWS